MIINMLQIAFGREDVAGEVDIDGKATYADNKLSVSFEVRCDQSVIVPHLVGRLEEAISSVFLRDQAPCVGAPIPGLVEEGSHGDSAVPGFMIETIDRLEKSITACSKELHEASKATVAVQERLSAVEAQRDDISAKFAIVASLRSAITTIDERFKRLEGVVFPPSSSRVADRAQESAVSPDRAMDEEAAQPRQSTGRVKQVVGAQQPAKPPASVEGTVAAAKLGMQPNAPAPDTAKAFGIDVDAAPLFAGRVGEEEPLDEKEDALPGTEKALTVADMLHDAMAKESCIAALKQLAKDASAYFGEIKNGSALPVTTLIFALAKYDLTGATPLDKWVAKRISEQDELRTYAKAIVDCLSEEGDEKRVARNCKLLAEHFVGPIAVAMSGRILPVAQLESALATARGTRANIKAAGAA